MNRRVVLATAVLSMAVLSPQGNRSRPTADSPPVQVIQVRSSDDSAECAESISHCTLRGAVAAASEHSTVQLPAARIVLRSGKPIDIEHSLTIVGESAELTVVDGLENGPLFRVRDGATLTLVGVSLLRGRTDDMPTQSRGTIQLHRSYLSGGLFAAPSRQSPTRLYCWTAPGTPGQFYESAELTDATAISLLPGRPF